MNAQLKCITRIVLCRIPLIFSILSAASEAQAVIPSSERAILISIYEATNGPGWTNGSWTGPAGSECNWFRVVCNSEQTHVISLFPSGNNLVGTLPPLDGLTALQSLDVSLNSLTGPLPALNGLKDLRGVSAWANQLSGQIPSLSGLTSLEFFNVDNNRLTGPIPSLDGLTSLRGLTLKNNFLTGTIPPLIKQKALQIVDVSNNKLTGVIPELSGLTQLYNFSAANNQLTGTIPSLEGPHLDTFDVSGNQLVGSIPPFDSQAGYVRYYYVGNNQLTGPIPPLNAQTSLLSFAANNNQLTGSIPSLSGMHNLRNFDVSDNQLTGSIPPLSGLQNLGDFNASNNQLTGSLATVLDGLTTTVRFGEQGYYYVGLAGFNVEKNQLDGTIPSIAAITTMQDFRVGSNQLTGPPPALSGLKNLRYFNADNNKLSGSIPPLTGLSYLQTFSAHTNQLTGSIPPLDGLRHLNSFYVEDNLLTGPVPVAPNSLKAGLSNLCGNDLSTSGDSTVDVAWMNAQDPRFAANRNWLTCQTPNKQNYSDSYWNANESGWGITITDHNSNMFVQWYTYDQSGHNQKYVISGGEFSNARCKFTGRLHHVTGPAWTLPNFDPNQVVRRDAGTAIIDFCPNGFKTDAIEFTYLADGVSGSKILTRLPFGSDIPHLGGTANTGGPDFTDLWWNPNESGWGVSVTQHGNYVFFRIFVYDIDGRPLLFVMPGGTMTSPTNFGGTLLTTTGPYFGSKPFDPARVVRTDAGTASMTFTDANNGVLTYTVNGVTNTKSITRLSF